jgi:hypothetical protein
MPKLHLLILVLFATLAFNASAQRMYMMNYKELEKHSRAAREPGVQCFVVYDTGDTLKGKELKKKHNKITGKVAWTLDGKQLELDRIRSYQDDDAYRIGSYYHRGKGQYSSPEYVRLINGPIRLYMFQLVIKSFTARGEVSYSTHSQFYLQKDSGYQQATTKTIESLVSDHQPAIDKLHSLFKTINEKETNDYRAIIEILEIYNKK